MQNSSPLLSSFLCQQWYFFDCYFQQTQFIGRQQQQYDQEQSNSSDGQLLPNQDGSENEVADYVVELNNDNFDRLTRYGKWLVEVHAPYCQPCKDLNPTWQKLARKLRDEKINVAKINGQQNRLLKNRFGTKLYPSIYFLNRGEAYEYPREGSRDFDALKRFAMGGYRTEKTLGWFGSPNSTFGRLYGEYKKITS
eukprot:TRINITY_DN8312_c0_g2_i1.p2 TRINITY_DN8312_c0_g2~~TRINITY_DN8312_c0_g2_i1.p2  ORF type:complete len:195 (-),score=9.00 TRINITY_DN8312_c0_g2_i1:418-1002(-)